MKVYMLRPDVNKYGRLANANEEDALEFRRRFDGTPMKNSWTGKERFEFPPGLRLIGDFPGLSTHIPVFNLKAVRILADFLEGNGELLPATCGGEDCLVFNVTRVIDALDHDNCQFIRFSNGKIMDVSHYSFFRKKLEGAKVFKIPEAVLMDVFVTDDFVERVKTSKLKGFEFRLVWSDEVR